MVKNKQMNGPDPVVKSLIELCAREGGHEFVADKAKVSADNLWQILKGIKLPSGNPRGVGARLRNRLTIAYPNWLAPKAEEPRAAYPVNLTIQTNQAIKEAENDAEALSLMAKALGLIFDGLPPDRAIRTSAFTQAANLILEVGRAAQRTQPVRGPAPAPTQEKQPEERRIHPI